ncbi:AraC family transcriptional regulator [soil metagenome]
MRATIEHVTHPDASLRVLDLSLPRFAGGPHRHPHIELTWIVQGQGLRFVGDSVEAFGAGDLVLIGAQLTHAWVGEPAFGETAPFRALVVQCPPEVLTDARWPELRSLQDLLARARQGVQFAAGPARDRAMAELVALSAEQGLARLARWLRLLQELADAPARRLSVQAASGDGHAAQGDRLDRLDRLLAWLHDQIATPIRIEQAAARVHISPAAFPRFFRRETGKTLIGYLNDLRTSQACLQLRHSRRPVAEIAAACGYPSLAHFERQFKKRMACSAREYRGGATADR